MREIYILFFVVWASLSSAWAQTEIFNFKRQLSDKPTSLFASVQSKDASSGSVTISGGDQIEPTALFTFLWGDNTTTSGFFPQVHKYTDTKQNYVFKVIAKYADNRKDSIEVSIDFVAPIIKPVSINENLKVIIPDKAISLGTHFYGPPTNLTYFTDDIFTGKFNRTNLQYLLSVLSTIEYDFVNSDLYLYNGKFEQYVLRDANVGGGYSLWFTDPVAFALGDVLIKGTPDFSSMAHEMGHNMTLNTPSKFIFGGKIDGNANAIFSESMGQIFQHAAGYELINNVDQYGIDAATRADFKNNFINSFKILKGFYQHILTPVSLTRLGTIRQLLLMRHYQRL